MGSFISIRQYLGNPDISWYQIPELSWSLAEISVSVLSICIPSFFYLFKRAIQGGVSSLFSTRDLSITPGKVLRGGSQDRQGAKYRLNSADGNGTNSQWSQRNDSATQAPLIHLADVESFKKDESNRAAPTELTADGIHVREDVVLSYQMNRQNGTPERRHEWM